MIWAIVTGLSGLFAGVLLYANRPILDAAIHSAPIRVSVLIPARNEEKNLPLLLEDLKKQTVQPYEIICADDASADRTAQVAESFGIRVIRLRDKPPGWIGKAWACQSAANAARGELILFLDADVRLAAQALGRLLGTYMRMRCVLSVQPSHHTERLYEQFSLFFNAVMIAANGVGFPWGNAHIGLFGPVILIDRQDYHTIGGHAAVKGNIVEDLALGAALRRSGLRYRLYLGDDDIAFRMYGGGIAQLLQGWTKNFATGAVQTPIWLLALIVAWVAGCLSAALRIVDGIAQGSMADVAVYVCLYLACVLQVRLISRRTGRFMWIASILYPVPLIAFLLLFTRSVIMKLFRFKVKWKGRSIASSRPQ